MRCMNVGLKLLSVSAAAVCAWGLRTRAEPTASLRLVDDWRIEVVVSQMPTRRGTDSTSLTATVAVPAPERVTVVAERYPALPVFKPEAPGWVKGVALRGLKAQECTTPGLLEPASLEVRAGPEAEAPHFERGRDYDADLVWGTVGRLTGGRVEEGQPVYVTYVHGLLRIDAVVLAADGTVTIRKGEPRSAAPPVPALRAGERLLGTVWVPGRLAKLESKHLFPVLETRFPEPPAAEVSPAERFLPQTLRKLQQGERVRVLAWGDSVTDGSYLVDPDRDRWQAQFVARLGHRFPQAKIELGTEAWGGRNTASYLAEPPGSVHNYAEKVLGARPDLVISEFVNDAGLSPEQVEERYARFLAEFKSIGAEWIILTPHYVRPDWMGLDRERDIDEDPRPYVAGLRQFAARHDVALADAAQRYGRLWRQGIPYSVLMLNSINHPDPRGLGIFADSLMALFP